MHISQLNKAVQGREFSIKFVKENGEIVSVDRCTCSSFYSRGATLNIRISSSGQTRKVRRITIIEINGSQLYL